MKTEAHTHTHTQTEEGESQRLSPCVDSDAGLEAGPQQHVWPAQTTASVPLLARVNTANEAAIQSPDKPPTLSELSLFYSFPPSYSESLNPSPSPSPSLSHTL